jgi:hypothetical protein
MSRIETRLQSSTDLHSTIGCPSWRRYDISYEYYINLIVSHIHMREKNLSVPVINLVLHVQIVRVVHETSSEGNAQFAFQELRDRVINMHILPPNEY